MSNLYTPDLMVAEQFFDVRRAGLDGERSLMLAVLRDAVECYQKYALARDPRGRFEFDEAQRWIDSSDRDWPYSFENICDVLDIDPLYLREGLERFAPRGLRREMRKPRIVALEDRRVDASSDIDFEISEAQAS
jgi:Arc/MetJ family transcription regulator